MIRNGLAASNQFGVGNQTDVFRVRNGQMTVSWVNGTGAWQGPVGIGPVGLFPDGAGVAASAQFGVADQTDVVAVATNGQLQVFWVDGGGAWQGPVGIGAAGLFPPGAAVVATRQYGAAGQTDVLAVGVNGQLYVAWVAGPGTWQGPVPFGAAGVFPPGAMLSATNQFGVPGQTDVLGVGNDGRLHVAWVENGSAWQGPAGFGPADFPPGASVATSPQYGVADQTIALAVDNGGTLRVAWADGAGGWQGPGVIGPAGVFPSGSPVVASPQFGVPDQTDVFAIGNDGRPHVAWVNGGGAWRGPVGIGVPNAVAPGSSIAATAQFGVANQTDVVTLDRAGDLDVYWVSGGGTWQGGPGVAIALHAVQDGTGRYVEVDGHGFTPGGVVVLDYILETGGAPDTHQTGQDDTKADGEGVLRFRIRVNLGSIATAGVKATDQATARSASATL